MKKIGQRLIRQEDLQEKLAHKLQSYQKYGVTTLHRTSLKVKAQRKHAVLVEEATTYLSHHQQFRLKLQVLLPAHVSTSLIGFGIPVWASDVRACH